jgi:ankyrin repeat protein
MFSGAAVNRLGPGGKSPLAEASGKGNLRMMQILLNEKADVELACPGYKNATPVTVAAMSQQHRAVDMLIKVSMIKSCASKIQLNLLVQKVIPKLAS